MPISENQTTSFTTQFTRNLVDEQPSTGEDRLNRDLAKMGLMGTRVAIRGQGYRVKALEDAQDLNQKKRQRANLDQENSSAGLGEKHPELMDLDGLPPDNLILPDSEDLDAASANDPALKNALKAGMSLNAAKEELRQKYQKKLENELKMRKTFNPDAPTPPRLTPG